MDGFDDDVELGGLAGLLEVGQQLLEFLHVCLADGCVGLQFDLPDLDSHVVVVVAGAVVRAGLAGIRPGAGVITRWRGQIIWSANSAAAPGQVRVRLPGAEPGINPAEGGTMDFYTRSLDYNRNID